jgi:tRNA-dihydrouridine synthase B
MNAVFYVRDIPIYGDLILSPMDGYSDLPFRAVCRELGSAMSYTEFINAIDIVGKHPRVHMKLAYLENERPVVYQIFDNDPERILKAALKLQDRKPDIIDINMGCSDPSVSGRGAGAGLLREPQKVQRIFELLSKNLSVPVTAKMRLGWDDSSRNYLEIARIVEDNGAALIAVHGRTKKQSYSGMADWDAIAEVRRAVSVPVIANGDVRTVADIQRIKAHTGCPAVMIGRAAVHNPWLFARQDREQVTFAEVMRLMRRQIELMLDFYGAPRGLILFRKYASRYLAPLQPEPELRRKLLTTESLPEFLEIAGSFQP